MQTPSTDHFHPSNLFSRERRRQRMLKFLEAFERRSWPGAAESPFTLPWSKDDLRHPALAGTHDGRR